MGTVNHLIKAAALTQYFQDKYRFRDASGSEPDATDDELAGLIYLADWKHAIKNGTQITDLQWKVQTGALTPAIDGDEDSLPTCDSSEMDCDVFNEEDQLFAALREIQVDLDSTLDPDDFEIADSILRFLDKFPSLTLFVDSTYPMAIRTQDTELDLGELADRFNRHKAIMSNRHT